MSFNKNHWPQIKALQFEDLCQILLYRMDENIKPISGSGGDQGIDSFTKSNKDSIETYQIKFFPINLTTSRKNKIRKSLLTALNSHKVSKWYLVIPLDQTIKMKEWYDKLQLEFPEVTLEWFGHTQLTNLLYKNPDLLAEYFNIGSLRLPNIKTERDHKIIIIIDGLKSRRQILDINEEELNKNIRCNESWKRNNLFFYLMLISDEIDDQIIISLSRYLQKSEIFVIYGSDASFALFSGKFPILPISENLDEKTIVNLILDCENFNL